MNQFDPIADLKAGLEKVTHCDLHPPLRQSESPEEAQLWWDTVQHCAPAARREHLRWLGRNDLFFLLVYLLNRKHFIRDERTAKWTFERCFEVQADPDGYCDTWPRESFKSEIITFGLTIQDILNNPEETFGFFSHTRPMSAAFLIVIKRELEMNELLKEVYDDILWQDPKIEARMASVPWGNHAITVKRKGNPKESTIEAWGLTDGQPTGRRFTKIVYDDVVARDQISMVTIDGTTDALKNSFLLTASDPAIYRYIGTFQEIGDTTQYVIDNGIFKWRKRGPLDKDGNVAFCSDAKFADMRTKLGTKVFALQILLDPTKSKSENEVGFKEEWWDTYDVAPPRRMMNVYGLVDPAGDSPDSNSQFALWVVGVCADKVARILDCVIDKLDLEDCWQTIFQLQQQWNCLKWGYEKYGHQRDIEHYRYRMKEVNNLFTIVPLGGIRMSKDQRIAQLIPWFKEHRIQFPRSIMRKLKDGREIDLLRHFKDREYLLWPYNPQQRDALDALARLTDTTLGIVFPRSYGQRGWDNGANRMGGDVGGDGGGSWLSE